MITPCFDKIGENIKFDLTEIKVSGYEGDTDVVFLDVLNNDGTTAIQYQWLEVDPDFPAGWYLDYSPVSEGDQTFEAGDGLWVTGDENYKVTFAGQVIEKGRGVALRFGATAVGNMLARTIDLNELKITGYEGDTDVAFLDILNNDGTTAVQYQWLEVDPDFPAGWYLDYTPVEDGVQTFDPGAGMWVTGDDGYSIEFPDL